MVTRGGGGMGRWHGASGFFGWYLEVAKAHRGGDRLGSSSFMKSWRSFRSILKKSMYTGWIRNCQEATIWALQEAGSAFLRPPAISRDRSSQRAARTGSSKPGKIEKSLSGTSKLLPSLVDPGLRESAGRGSLRRQRPTVEGGRCWCSFFLFMWA